MCQFGLRAGAFFAAGLLIGYALRSRKHALKRQLMANGVPVVNDAESWAARSSPSKGMIAFYSSIADAVTTSPELMNIAIDDHAIVRGHAVFDTASLCNGRLYRLTAHLDRLMRSAHAAKLPLPFGEDAADNVRRMTEVIRATCAAGGQRDAVVRYWLTAGPGNLGLTPTGCTPAFYVLVFGGMPFSEEWATHGISEATVPEQLVPFKPVLLAELKSNNYMLNAMTAMAAVERGGVFGIQVDSAGFLRESCALNVAIVTHDGVMRTPPFKGILAGTTLRRAMELSPPLLSEGILSAIKQEEVSLADALAAAEMILFAGDTHIFPVTKLDDKAIGDGMIGPVARAFEQRIQEDAADGKDCHHVVPGL